jgi:hypothetical protein
MAKSQPHPRGNVLLLSCMDLRLMDDIVYFMDDEGLTNRYDHVILAGAALGALGGNLSEYGHWKATFIDHLQKAYELHQIKDVIIIDHRDCGAYKYFLEKQGEQGSFNENEARKESRCHLKYAKQLREAIDEWATGFGVELWVKSFLMDLRGDVELLEGPIKVGEISKKNKRPLKKSGKKRLFATSRSAI